MKRFLCLLLVIPVLLIGACSDDPASPESFLVTVRVTDSGGAPVEGLSLFMLSDNEFLQDSFADKAAVSIIFRMSAPGRATLTVEDVEGDPVMTLLDEPREAGDHSIVWGGWDDDHVYQSSGRYTVRMVARDAQGLIAFEETRDMQLASMSVPVGVTDKNGKIQLRDRRLFPHLYDLPAMSATNESGEIQGDLVLDENMILRLADDSYTATVTRRRQVDGNGAVVELVWDPQTALPLEPREAGRPSPTHEVDVPPIPYALANPSPNPFN